MRKDVLVTKLILSFVSAALLTSCAGVGGPSRFNENYAAQLPQHENTNGEKLVLVDPKIHAWGAYNEQGDLVRAGIATAGGRVCPEDSNEPDCRTSIGTYRITSIGGEDCISRTYPKPDGGGLMPYCMHFNNGEALHGSPDQIVIKDNVSHGCVRMRIQDAEWMYSNFASVGTKVKVLPYES